MTTVVLRRVSGPAAVAAGLCALWVLALAAGAWRPLAGGVVAALGLAGAAAWAVRARPDLLRSVDVGVWGLVLMALSPLVPARWGPSFHGVGADDLPLLVGTVLAAWSVGRREGWARILHPVAIPLALFALWTLLSHAVTGTLTLGTFGRGFGRWALFAVAFGSALRLAERKGYPRLIFGAVLLVGLGEALFGLWAYFLGWGIHSTVKAWLIGLQFWRPYEALFGVTPGRVTGTLGLSSNFFGALMLFPTALGAAYFVRAKGWREGVIYAAATAACWFGLVYSYTRASLLAMLVAFAVLLVLTRSRRLLALVMALVLVTGLFTPAFERFTEGHNRWALTRVALQIIGGHALIGVGAYEEAEEARTPENPGYTPHNSYLLAAAETGVPGGILLFVATVLPGALVGWAAVRRRHPLVVATAAAMLAYGIQTFSNNLFHIPTVAVSYWLVAAAALGLAGEERGRWPGSGPAPPDQPEEETELGEEQGHQDRHHQPVHHQGGGEGVGQGHQRHGRPDPNPD